MLAEIRRITKMLSAVQKRTGTLSTGYNTFLAVSTFLPDSREYG
jgi:hypothetical protein